MAYRLVKAKWKIKELQAHLASIRLVGIDNIGIVNQITEIISNQHNVNMKAISFEANDGIFEGKIKVLVYDKDHLEQLTNQFELIEGVKRVERWDSQDEE
jgi:GTP pyrophosphokinase